MALERYPRNPNYGGGALHRRIRLRSAPGMVIACLDDNHHAMQCRIHHNGQTVTAIESEMIRAPMSPCPGAKLVLQELVGERVARSADELAAGGRARRHCTHLFDLALLAIGFAAEGAERRRIDVVVPDAVNGLRTVRAWVDCVLVIDWTTQDDVIVAPETWRGQDIRRGFVRRAVALTTGVERDAALMTQKTVIVARGRSHVFDKQEGAPVYDAGEMLGACYSYSEAHYPGARQIAGHVVDFSSGVIEAPDLFGSDQAAQRPAFVDGGERRHG